MTNKTECGLISPALTEEDRAYNRGFVAGELVGREEHCIDAFQYLPKKYEMCDVYFEHHCVGCPFDKAVNKISLEGCTQLEREYPAEAVRLVQEWHKDE